MKYIFQKKEKNKFVSGFTLIELMVASSLFLVVMLIVSGSIFSVFNANNKSKNLRSVMDNLNLTLESMTRTIRFGNNYNCGSTGDISKPQDCASGAPSLTITDVTGNQVTYSTSTSATRISRTIGANTYYITSPDLTLTYLRFFVLGSAPYTSADTRQPRIVIVASGYVGAKATSRSTFTIQTTVSQRDLDFTE